MVGVDTFNILFIDKTHLDVITLSLVIREKPKHSDHASKSIRYVNTLSKGLVVK